MGDFSPPFADSGTYREPTTDEQANGFPCGPADRSLFNGLIRAFQGELGDLISYAGLTGSSTDLTQVRQAVLALIAAATGGGDPSAYLTMAQARARLPIFPEISSTDGRINIYSPATGTVRVPAGIDLVHRGVYIDTTVETDFTTVANKTYHIRWSSTGGLAIKDLADTAVYNPSSYAETNMAFDSTYDDALLARVTTNSSNVASITNLANKNQLIASGEIQGPTGGLGFKEYENGKSPSNITKYATQAINWARTPLANLSAFDDMLIDPASVATWEYNVGIRALSRYQLAIWAQGDADIWVGWNARV